VDTWSWLAIFAIVEITMWWCYNWRPSGILYVVVFGLIVILSMLIKDLTVDGTSVNIECMPLI
jgi:hypothetical protein